MHYLSVCAIFKNEGPYLEEWLRFYDVVGVDHFVLYDNGSTDVSMQILQPWISAGRVTRFEALQHPVQMLVYHHCLETFRQQSRWIAFLDLDEFLFSPVQPHLPTVLRDYDNEAGVVANWAMFGASGHERKPSGPVTRNYTRRCEANLCTFEPALLRSPNLNTLDPASYYPICAHVKSIVNTQHVAGIGASPHHFAYRDGRLPVNARHIPVPGAFAEPVDLDLLRVNHYFSRSLEEFEMKLRRGRSDTGAFYDRAAMIARNKQFDAVEDELILPLASQVQARMGTAVAASARA